MPQCLRSPDLELRDLRHRYNLLCARVANAGSDDPALLARTVQELQELSNRIAALEMRSDTAEETRQRRAAGPASGSNRPSDATASGAVIAFQARRTARPEAASAADRVTGSAQPLAGAAAESAASTTPPARRDVDARHGAAPDSAHGGPVPDATPPARDAPAPDRGAPTDLDRLRTAIERQEEQVAAMLRRCDAYREQFEILERHLAERDPAERLIPRLDAISSDLARQQRRITELAVALERLLRWLAAERRRPKG